MQTNHYKVELLVLHSNTIKHLCCFKIKLSALDNNTWNHLTVCKQMSSDSFNNVSYKLLVYKLYIYIYIYIYVRAGRPAFARPCVGIHKSTSLMSSSLLLQQCPACLVLLTWIVFVIGGRWPYSWCLVGCCCQDLFRIARSILV